MIARLIIGILFIVFASVQYNDPDPWLWIVAYGIVGIVILISIKKDIPKPILWGLLLVFTISTAWYVPKMMSWIDDGMPSIVGEMQASTPHIEWMREFLGLVLCVAALFWMNKTSAIEKLN